MPLPRKLAEDLSWHRVLRLVCASSSSLETPRNLSHRYYLYLSANKSAGSMRDMRISVPWKPSLDYKTMKYEFGSSWNNTYSSFLRDKNANYQSLLMIQKIITSSNKRNTRNNRNIGNTRNTRNTRNTKKTRNTKNTRNTSDTWSTRNARKTRNKRSTRKTKNTRNTIQETQIIQGTQEIQ